jgi:hypothetical protein
VDGRGATHYLSSSALGESGQAVQLSIRAAFGAEQECSLPSVAEVRDRQRVITPEKEHAAPDDSGVNIAAVAAKGMENVADAVGTLASGLENFLFGSSKGGQQSAAIADRARCDPRQCGGEAGGAEDADDHAGRGGSKRRLQSQGADLHTGRSP